MYSGHLVQNIQLFCRIRSTRCRFISQLAQRVNPSLDAMYQCCLDVKYVILLVLLLFTELSGSFAPHSSCFHPAFNSVCNYLLSSLCFFVCVMRTVKAHVTVMQLNQMYGVILDFSALSPSAV